MHALTPPARNLLRLDLVYARFCGPLVPCSVSFPSHFRLYSSSPASFLLLFNIQESSERPFCLIFVVVIFLIQKTNVEFFFSCAGKSPCSADAEVLQEAGVQGGLHQDPESLQA